MTNAPDIKLARAYDDADTTPGARLLVDLVWPRGIGKDDLDLDDRIREVAPSDDLRKWWSRPAVERYLARGRIGTSVLLYGAKDHDHNQAGVLRRI